MTSTEYVILVDAYDHEIGIEKKTTAHRLGKQHRAFSVFIFNNKNNEKKLLLQQRQKNKYHSGGLWTNTCCSHPRPGENIITAGERRLQEEMGIRIPLQKVGEFQYTAQLDNGLIENEYDHVLIGYTPIETIPFNQKEVADVRWVSLKTLEQELLRQPEKFTSWFEPALKIALRSS
ncbi:MAG: isopentenyl-diphosphate delta-isomerase [Coxiella sp. RIFCSPHIGHO2_12_FULL_44_14]|nr:MAG: isopentenyl-diphosphate delta-isomerase [Coxiella sp. RIFCSPHIGHO2_12_FULL_44_14]